VKRVSIIALAVVSVVLVSGLVAVSKCDEDGDPGWGWGPLIAEDLKADVERDTDPDATSLEVRTLVDGNATFAFNMYRQVAVDRENLFFSPHSISTALAMTWAGANGETSDEMKEVLGFSLEEARVHEAFNALDADLDGRDQEGVQLILVNDVWVQDGWPLLAWSFAIFQTPVHPFRVEDSGQEFEIQNKKMPSSELQDTGRASCGREHHTSRFFLSTSRTCSRDHRTAASRLSSPGG
jgi:hypothetical protein